MKHLLAALAQPPSWNASAQRWQVTVGPWTLVATNQTCT